MSGRDVRPEPTHRTCSRAVALIWKLASLSVKGGSLSPPIFGANSAALFYIGKN